MTPNKTVEPSTHRQQLIRIIALTCLAIVPVAQLVIIALAATDYQICFGDEGGWRAPRDLHHLASGALQRLIQWDALLSLAFLAVPVLPAILCAHFYLKRAPLTITALAIGYLCFVTIPLANSGIWHDCDGKGLNFFELLPPVLSSLATLCFLLVAGTIFVFKKSDDQLT